MTCECIAVSLGSAVVIHLLLLLTLLFVVDEALEDIGEGGNILDLTLLMNDDT